MSTNVPDIPTTTSHTEYMINEAITLWMSTSASQIFFMQLGFLCYEVGFVKPIWAPSIILKNIEDTFVGILTYLCFTHTLAFSDTSLGGIISIPENLFLMGIPVDRHEEVFVSSVFATTCATIISGGVLERMKNKAYIIWCFLTILINYSFVAHWVWHPDGWLAQLGYMDGTGSVVVHSTGGVAALIAIWRLGPRRGQTDREGNLLPINGAARPIVNAIGVFILWYGWFAFNISSPIAAEISIGPAIGTVGLVTCLAPTCSCCSALLMMRMGWAKLTYDNLLGALLGGLVAITGSCYTVSPWAAAIIGFFSSPVFFIFQYLVRHKWGLDDPLQILPIHLFCGLYACIMEGIFANHTMRHPGLIEGDVYHFGVQILGTFVCFIFNVIVCLFLWFVMMEKCLYRNKSIKVSVLDTYLGTKMFNLNNTLALNEVLCAKSNLAKQMLWSFHNFTVKRLNNEQFDFLVVVNIFRDLMQNEQFDYSNIKNCKIANVIIKIINAYILDDSIMCVNVSGEKRSQMIKIKNQLKYAMRSKRHQHLHAKHHRAAMSNTGKNGGEVSDIVDVPARNRVESILSSHEINELINDEVFDNIYHDVFKLTLPLFTRFLQTFDKKKHCVNYNVKLPFQLQNHDWMLIWDIELQKETFDTKKFSNAVLAGIELNKQSGDSSWKESTASVIEVTATNSKQETTATGGSNNNNNTPKTNHRFISMSVPEFIIHPEYKPNKKLNETEINSPSDIEINNSDIDLEMHSDDPMMVMNTPKENNLIVSNKQGQIAVVIS